MLTSANIMYIVPLTVTNVNSLYYTVQSIESFVMLIPVY
jgi:hypothetical protein